MCGSIWPRLFNNCRRPDAVPKAESVSSNRNRRTRRDLLDATNRLLRRGANPTLEDVAKEALVSRATAYRYFPNIEALLVEAALDVAAPVPETVFANGQPVDPVSRLEKVDAAFNRMIVENEAPLRMMLAHSLERRAKRTKDGDVPVRQNRRTQLIEAALSPVRKQFRPTDYDRLKKILALLIGTEAFVVFRDVLNIDDSEANSIKHWAMKALVDAARKPSRSNDH